MGSDPFDWGDQAPWPILPSDEAFRLFEERVRILPRAQLLREAGGFDVKRPARQATPAVRRAEAHMTRSARAAVVIMREAENRRWLSAEK